MTWRTCHFITSGGNEVIIRPAVPQDAWGFVASLDAVCREGRYLLHERAPRTPLEQERIIRMLDTERNLLMIAEIKGIVVGGMGLYVGGASPKAQYFCNLGIHLVKGARGMGIGDRMLAAGVDWAAERNYHKICLTVFANNQRALKLYQRRGFVEEGRRCEQYRIGKNYVDEILLARFLP